LEYKAVIFDLFETLITEWGHEKYTQSKMCSDLGIEQDLFRLFWEEKEKDRYLGRISFADSILYVCEKCNREIDSLTLESVLHKRVKTKSACFEYLYPDVYQLLAELKARGLKLAIVSNCSSEEVQALRESKIYPYFDEVILSYEAGMKKPDRDIYEKAVKRLGIHVKECIFVGDGGSNELEGAKNAGMEVVQAKWYTNRHPCPRGSMEGFLTAENPLHGTAYSGTQTAPGVWKGLPTPGKVFSRRA